MNAGTPIQNFEKATTIPENTLHLVEMGDGSGTKVVTQKTLVEEAGKVLKIGDLAELQTKNKANIIAAINEVAQSGGSGSGTVVDILDSQEEIEANTEPEKVAGALAVKQLFGELNDNLGGCSLEQEGDDFYIVGADAVRKKLGSGAIKRTRIFSGNSKSAHTIDITPYEGYRSFTADNFCLANVKLTYGSGNAYPSSNTSIIKEYSADNGILYLNSSGSMDGNGYTYYATYDIDLLQ